MPDVRGVTVSDTGGGGWQPFKREVGRGRCAGPRGGGSTVAEKTGDHATGS
jgi:hypothetical protein